MVDGILKFLGSILNAIYGVIPSYGVAIILLTILVRLVLFPLAVKQIRSMTAMQKIQPKLKELQKKHKGDRQKLNEEMMKLYREHGVNPLGGCFPMLLQLPVFIALYAVIRSSLVFDAAIQPTEITIPITKDTVCRPVSGAGEGDTIRCVTNGDSQTFTLASGQGVVVQKNSTSRFDALPNSVVRCTLGGDAKKGVTAEAIQCSSPLGTGHLPSDGKLFAAIVQDKASFLGMHLACSPTQASSKSAIQQCTVDSDAGGPALIGYYALVVLMVGTTYYQQRQMVARQKGSPRAQQMQLMMKIMPVFMGFLSLNFPAALSLYWVIGNFWMIGQQHFILQHQDESPNGGAAEPVRSAKPKPASRNGRPGGKNRSQGRSGKRRR